MAIRYLNSGRNASSGYKRDRKQTIPGRKWSESAKTGEEASQRARSKRESQKTPSVPKVEKQTQKSNQNIPKLDSKAIEDINAYRQSQRSNTKAIAPEESIKRNNYRRYQGQSISNSKPVDATITKMDSYINAGKLSKEQVKEAKALLKSEQTRRQQAMKDKNTKQLSDAMVPGTEEYNRYQKEMALNAKVNNAGTMGALLPFLKASNAITKGVEKVTNTENTKGAQALNKSYNTALDLEDLSAAQSPIKHGVGNFVGNAALYSATNPLFDSAAEGVGITSAAGKFIANQIAQNAQDVALDTLPEYQRLKDKGLSDAEIRSEISKNLAWNAAGNLAMPFIGKGINTVMDKTGAKQALRNVWDSLSDAIKQQDIPKVNAPQVETKNIDMPRLNAEDIKANRFNGQPTVISQLESASKNVAKSEAQPIFKKTSYDTAKEELDNLYKGYDVRNINDSDWKNIINDTSAIATKYSDDPDYARIRDLASQKMADLNNQVYNAKGAVDIPANNDELKYIDHGIEWIDPNSSSQVSVKTMLDSVRNDIAKYDNVELHPTTRKNVDSLRNAVDYLEDAYRTGDNFDEAYDTYRKAMNRVKDNMKSKEGIDEWENTYKTTLNWNNPDNISYRYKHAPTQVEDFDEWVKNNPEEYAGLPFNDEYKVMAEDTGIPKRQGVQIDIRNTDNMRVPSEDILTSEQKLSAVRGNSLENSGIYNEQELKEVVPEELFMNWSQAEKLTYEDALSNVAKNEDRLINKYTQDYSESVLPFLKKDNDISNIRSGQDIDEMFILQKNLTEKARAATDPVEKKKLYDQARKIALNLKKAGTEYGREIQAFAKWTRTPEGAVISAQGFAEEAVENALKKNPKMASEIKDVSKEIESFLDEMDESAMTRQEIEDMITAAISKRDQLKKRVNKGDIRRIADAILNDKQYTDIEQQLEFLSTGFENIDAETLDQVQQIFETVYDMDFNSRDRVLLEDEAYRILANKIVPNGGSFRDKFDAWRYLAMLANPTTHIKNIVGNELFGKGMVTAKNTLAAALEAGYDRVSKAMGEEGIERTKSILTPRDANLIKASEQDALQNAYRELSGNKYFSTGEGINKAISAFNTQTKGGRILNTLSETNADLLSAEDEAAVIAKYKTSLAGFLKANGADASIFNATDDASKELLESGRAYAINQAKEAAFHQDSAVADALSQFSKNARNSDSKVLRAIGLGADVVVPFKKTPINILKSAIEYSPAEFIKVASDIPKLNKGLMKPAEFIDDISKGVTGTAALGIGALLAYNGILKIGSDKSDEEASFDKQTGRQNVALKVGDRYVKLDELIPSAAPFIFGATVYETIANNKGNDNALNTVFSGMSAIANGVTDMTMLSGIADTLNSIRYAQDKSEVWQKLGIDTIGNLASQMLPTLGRKANVTFDDTRRSTYSDQSGAMKTIDQEAKYLQTKVPFLQQAGEAMQNSSVPFLQSVGNRLALQPDIDVKGQVRESPGVAGFDNFLGRTINNFVSPVNITQDESTVFDNERRRLANATGEMGVLPYIASSEATIDDRQLTPEEWTQYRQARGQMREDLATNLISTEYYRSVADTDKAELLGDIDDFTKAYSQSKFGKELSGTNQKLADIYEASGTEGLLDHMVKGQQIHSLGVDATEKMYNLIDKGGTKAIQQYLDVKSKATTINDKGGESLLKADVMNEILKLPKDQQAIMYDAFNISKTKEEQAAYDKGGANAAIAEYQKAKKESDKKATKKASEEKQAAKAAGVSVDKMDDLQAQLASYGAIDSPDTVKYYGHAKQTIPSLTPKGYVNKLHEIGGNDYKIQQDEMLSYLTRTNASQEEANKLWNAYGDWKTIPYLKKDGTWGKKKQ